jgi:hypothetical protein
VSRRQSPSARPLPTGGSAICCCQCPAVFARNQPRPSRAQVRVAERRRETILRAAAMSAEDRFARTWRRRPCVRCKLSSRRGGRFLRFLLAVSTVRFWASPPRCLAQRDWSPGGPRKRNQWLRGRTITHGTGVSEHPGEFCSHEAFDYSRERVVQPALQHRAHHLANDILECLGAGLLAPPLVKCGKLRDCRHCPARRHLRGSLITCDQVDDFSRVRHIAGRRSCVFSHGTVHPLQSTTISQKR